MKRRQFLVGTAAVSTAIVAGCSSGSGGGADVVETTSVSMTDSQFDPRNIAVEEGATVTWSNDDGHSHTITSASDNWEKDMEVDGGGESTHTFDESGVYEVYCRFHGSADLSGMSMKIAVGDASIDDPLGAGGGGGGPY